MSRLARSLRGTYLDEIVSWHRERAARDVRQLDELVDLARSSAAPRGFARAIDSDGVCVIAEVKRRSPSKGPLAPTADAGDLARAYASGGAAAVSVLTDAEFFGGSPEDVSAVRSSCGLPILRKDFTVDPRDVCDARIMGADAVLLIVAALDREELRDFIVLSDELAMDALVEVHDREELEVALDAGARLVGVNQRDLRTFRVDRGRAEALASQIPGDVVSVAESGIGGPADVARLASAGFDAVLVGEHLVTSDDPDKAVRTLVEAGSSRPNSGRHR